MTKNISESITLYANNNHTNQQKHHITTLPKTTTSLTIPATIILLVILITLITPTLSQWDPKLDGLPQWQKPIVKRSVGADEPYPPWNAPLCPPHTSGYCMLPPYYPYHTIRRAVKNIGVVLGRSLAYMPYRFINMFLGVPYAKPPVYERRFKPPEDVGPNWDYGEPDWDASYYRDACPQELYRYQERYYTQRNMSEDCLHLNIFAPNLTDRPQFKNEKYPIMVLLVGDDFKDGDAMLYPAHLIARKEVLVVTFNYRLGALGFLTSMDSNSPGNYGLMDVIHLLKWIQVHIQGFGGDKNRITLVGHGSGAAMVGLLMISPKSYYRGRPLFHQAILMSGNDLCEWSVVSTVWNANPATYTRDLGRLVGCGSYYDLDMKFMVECLRGKHYEEMVNATAALERRYGSLAGPFGPVVDGDYLPDTPKRLRAAGKYMKIKVLSGFPEDAGAYIVEKLTSKIKGLNLETGLSPYKFKSILQDMVKQRAAVQNVYEVAGAIEFEYTYWAKPDNRTAVLQNLVDMWTDQMYGSCVDHLLKYQSFCSETDKWDLSCPPSYMYLFTHRSEYEPLPLWMGVPYGRDLDYLIGYPFFNETMGNITGIVPEQQAWTLIDRNVSDFFQMTLVNFTKYGNPTPDWQRNVSWFQFWRYNLSYLYVSEFSYMDLDYRQNHFSFWRDYYPSVSIRRPVTTTPIPTPRPRIEYQIANWTLVAACLITLIILIALSITLYYNRTL